jgi:hypothetical protein
VSEIIAWCAFVGAWLLVAGPIFQAAIELSDEDFERDAFERAIASLPRTPRVSRWWLMAPPVAYVLHARRRRRQRAALLRTLDRTQLEQLMHFRETAEAWIFVASGAGLIAVKETWDLHEHYGWPVSIFWAIVATMIAGCTANTSMRIRRRDAILEAAREPG